MVPTQVKVSLCLRTVGDDSVTSCKTAFRIYKQSRLSTSLIVATFGISNDTNLLS